MNAPAVELDPLRAVAAEQSVLGALMLDNGSLARIDGMVAAEDFATDDHVAIFDALAALIARNSAADPVTLADELTRAGKLETVGGIAYLAALVENVPTAANVTHYANIVRDRANLRRVVAAASRASDAARGPGADVHAIADSFADAMRKISANSANDAALAYRFADELGDDGDEADELIERLLTRRAMSVAYGDSNCGKTFIAIDIGAAVAREAAWMGRNVEAGMVVYLATESPASVRMRLRAYQRHHKCTVPNFVIVQSPIDLYNGDADTVRIIELVRALEQRHRVKCELVIGDTLSRLSAGANENSGEDMSIVVRHVDRIRHECATHFLLIHHTGKDAARGMRGWSGMRAATDTEIEITSDADTGTHAAEITKQRDIPGKGDRIGFRLQVVELGVGKWARPVTSCVVVGADAPAKQAQSKRPSEIAGAITELLTTRGAGMRKRELVDHFAGRYTSPAVYKELKKMSEAGKLREVVGVVALVREQ